MSLSCAFTTSLTLAASAYDIFGIFGLTAKQPLLSTVHLDDASVHSEEAFLETVAHKSKGVTAYVSLLHDETQDQEREGGVNTSALAAVVKKVASGDEDTIETEETEETDETEKTVEGRVHSNMVYFDTHTQKTNKRTFRQRKCAR
jgi:hypothetical protein